MGKSFAALLTEVRRLADAAERIAGALEGQPVKPPRKVSDKPKSKLAPIPVSEADRAYAKKIARRAGYAVRDSK